MSARSGHAAGGPFDLAVVGGGIAGLVAAVRATELGLRPVVLEKGDEALYRCNTRYTGGFFHVCQRGVTEDAAALTKAILDATRGCAHPGLTAAVASDSRLAVDWLKKNGMRFMRSGLDGFRKNLLAPPALLKPGLHWQGRGGDMMLRTLEQRLTEQGGHLLRGARATRLVMSSGKCLGVAYQTASGENIVHTSSVVLCDGGFQADPTLLREFVTPAPEKLKQRGAATGAGDALRMARDAGAALVGMENIYGHLLCDSAMNDDRLWPYPILDFIVAAGVAVDGSGRRFADEGLGGVSMTNCVVRLADPHSTSVIFDRAIWEGPATQFLLPANPHLVLAGGKILASVTLAGLAQQLGLPAQAVAQTIADYNAAVASSTPHLLSPPRTVSKHRAYPISEPPYYAVRIVPGITYTMGGLAIDELGQVLRPDGAPIPGLYASGCATGGLDGGPTAAYIGGLTKSAVTSLRVAAHIAKRRVGSSAKLDHIHPR